MSYPRHYGCRVNCATMAAWTCLRTDTMHRLCLTLEQEHILDSLTMVYSQQNLHPQLGTLSAHDESTIVPMSLTMDSFCTFATELVPRADNEDLTSSSGCTVILFPSPKSGCMASDVAESSSGAEQAMSLEVQTLQALMRRYEQKGAPFGKRCLSLDHATRRLGTTCETDVLSLSKTCENAAHVVCVLSDTLDQACEAVNEIDITQSKKQVEAQKDVRQRTQRSLLSLEQLKIWNDLITMHLTSPKITLVSGSATCVVNKLVQAIEQLYIAAQRSIPSFSSITWQFCRQAECTKLLAADEFPSEAVLRQQRARATTSPLRGCHFEYVPNSTKYDTLPRNFRAAEPRSTPTGMPDRPDRSGDSLSFLFKR